MVFDTFGTAEEGEKMKMLRFLVEETLAVAGHVREYVFSGNSSE